MDKVFLHTCIAFNLFTVSCSGLYVVKEAQQGMLLKSNNQGEDEVVLWLNCSHCYYPLYRSIVIPIGISITINNTI